MQEFFKMSKYPVKTTRKAINNPYDIRNVYTIETNEWFGSLEFLSIGALNKFLEKEGKL